MPLVSVVTIVKNGKRHLEPAIGAVLSQTYPNVEYIVKDGGSTDGTLDVLERFRHRIARIESSPDTGISDAWNQALALVNGTYVALLNCDDRWPPDFLERAVGKLRATNADLTFGDTILVDEASERERRVSAAWEPTSVWRGTGFLHPGVVTTRAAYQRVGKFRDDLRFAMDTDWLFRLHRAGGRFVKHDSYCYMSTAGVSNRHWLSARTEYLKVLRDNGTSLWQRGLAWVWLQALRVKRSFG